MTQLSDSFSLEEMVASQAGARAGVDNAPTPEIIGVLTATCQQAEAVRTLLAHPMIVQSGFRSSAVNKLVGGAPDSAHLFGYAMDFIAPAFGDPLAICRAISESAIRFDQLIQEGDWVHISFDPRYRMQVLTAKFVSKTASYSDGLGV